MNKENGFTEKQASIIAFGLFGGLIALAGFTVLLKDGKVDQAIHQIERSASSLASSKFDDICAQANVGVTNPNNLCTPSDLEAHGYTIDRDGSLISPSGDLVIRKLKLVLDKEGNLVDNQGIIHLHAAKPESK